MEFLILI